MFLCILDGYLKDTALDGPGEDNSWNKISTGKVKHCKTRRRSCVAVFFSIWTRTMQVLFVLRFYHPAKTDKINRLIHAIHGRNDMSRVVKQLLRVIKLFRATTGCIHSFRIRSKGTLRIMYPKYPVLDMIQRIHLHCGSFGSIIRFWILVKKRNIRPFLHKKSGFGFW